MFLAAKLKIVRPQPGGIRIEQDETTDHTLRLMNTLVLWIGILGYIRVVDGSRRPETMQPASLALLLSDQSVDHDAFTSPHVRKHG